MQNIVKIIKEFLSEERSSIAENAAMIVLFLIIAVAAVMFIGDKVKAAIDQAGDQLDAAESKEWTY